MLVLGYHHPLEIAKRYGTLDRVSDGRLVLGVGVGSLKEEFDLLGAPFDDRGERADDAIRALRAASVATGARVPRDRSTTSMGSSWTRAPSDPRTPIWIGGRTARLAAPRGRARRRLGAVRPLVAPTSAS